MARTTVEGLVALMRGLADEYEAVVPNVARELRGDATAYETYPRRAPKSSAYQRAITLQERADGFRRDGNEYTDAQREAMHAIAARILAATR